VPDKTTKRLSKSTGMRERGHSLKAVCLQEHREALRGCLPSNPLNKNENNAVRKKGPVRRIWRHGSVGIIHAYEPARNREQRNRHKAREPPPPPFRPTHRIGEAKNEQTHCRQNASPTTFTPPMNSVFRLGNCWLWVMEGHLSSEPRYERR